ncbi:MAG TPA: hypothetical protein VGF91_23510 [Solirubrobacteraceae bacterium]|jgi:hypothetical protein
MSPYLHYEIARSRQHEMARRAINSHRSHTMRTAVRWQRRAKHRLVQMAATLGVLVVAGTAVTVSDARSTHNPMKQHAVHLSAQQLAREIRVLEHKGYVPTACTVSGTLMRNYSTGQSTTVKS